MDYGAWDNAMQDAIVGLDVSACTSRSQRFIRQFPNALTEFRARLATTSLQIPLADFQSHPTYLLRWLLAQWKDEERKVLRTDLHEIMSHSIRSVQATQEWRSGKGENWSLWGYRDMDDLYNNLRTTEGEEAKLQAWYFQRFCGLDKSGHPVHFEVLPSTHEEALILPLCIRRIVNNEHTLRHRIPHLNPPPPELLEGSRSRSRTPDDSARTADALSNPILGATWILDARRLSIWYASAIYKTASALIDHSTRLTSAHYPEQGHRAVVLNLGVVFGSMYNVAMKAMPATTQASTRCYIGNAVLDDLLDPVPEICRAEGATRLTLAEQERYRHDDGPFVAARV